MKLVSKRTAALLLTLCLMVSLCSSLSVWAVDTTVAASTDNGVAEYRLFYDGLDGYTARGVVNILKNSTNLATLNSLYNSGTINFLPYAAGGTGTAYFSDHTKIYTHTDGTCYAYGNYQGVMMYGGSVDSYMAFKIKSPGAGTYSVSLNYFIKGHSHADYGLYLLPASTATSAVASSLTEDNKIGIVSVEYWNHTNGGTYSGVANAQYTVGDAGEYILAIKAEKDNAADENNRVDMSVTGVTFVKEGSAPTLTGSVPIDFAVENPVRTNDFYKAINGKATIDGETHEMLYLLFKGNTLWVYDITAGEIYDVVEEYMTSHPSDACIDPNGILWVSGSGNYIGKYDPSTKTVSRVAVDETVMGTIGNLYAVTYYNDGTNERLYFGTCYSAKLGYYDLKTNKTVKLTETVNADGLYSAYGGIYIDPNGEYLYTTVDGDKNEDQTAIHAVVKVDMETGEVVQTKDLSWEANPATGLSQMGYADGKLFITCTQKTGRPLVIDISGETMTLLSADAITGLDSSFTNMMSAQVDGKTYFVKKADYLDGNKTVTKAQIHQYDTATDTVTNLGIVAPASFLSIGTVATLDGKTVLIAPRNMDDDTIDLYIYDPAAKTTTTRENIGNGLGNGHPAHSLTIDATGRYVFVGGYGTTAIGIYDVLTGALETIESYGHQSDSMRWYNGFLWVGNYNQGTITRIEMDADMKQGEVKPVMNLMETAFQQKRMLGGLAVGDGKVFCGTVPDTGMVGGALTWYDAKIDRLYVAMGPNPEDVYYTDDTFIATQITSDTENYVWRRASDDQIVPWDKTDAYLKDEAGNYILDEGGSAIQRFNGVITDMCINSVTYYNGYIVGTTTQNNGSASEGTDANPVIFVYDVENRCVVATCDLSAIDADFASAIGVINVVEADPYEDGKFWGTAASRLFSFTVTADGKIENLKEELYSGNDSSWSGQSSRGPKSIVFDGEYLYTAIDGLGLCMVNTEDPTDYKVLTATIPELMVQGYDGNLYFLSGSYGTHLVRVSTSFYTNYISAQSVQARIDGLDAQKPDEKEVTVARKMYDALVTDVKAMVDPANLIAAENGFTVLLSKGDSQVYYADIADALAAATAGSVLTLQNDATTDKQLTLLDGITLELNGHKLTAKSLFGFPSSRVIDSSENGAGVLDAELESLSASNPQLPLYDSTRGGYRFFTGSMKALGIREGNNDNAQFWFRMEFANPEAYRLLANGDSGITVGGSLLVGEDTTFTVQFQNNTVKTYGQKQVNAANGQIAGIYLNVTSISAADGDAITLIPYAASGGVTVTVSDEDIELLTRKSGLEWEQGAGFWDEV